MAVLDIDGTLLNSKSRISEKTIDVIKKLQKRGIIVTLCTGRNIRNTLGIYRLAGIKSPFISTDGAVLFDPEVNKVLDELKLESETAIKIIETADKRDVFIELSNGYDYYKSARQKELFKYDIYTNRSILRFMRNRKYGVKYINHIRHFKKVPGPYYQIVLAGAPEALTKTILDIKDINVGEIDVRDNLWENYAFVNQRGICKANGVQMLCKYHNIDMSEVIAIGDQSNDIDMVERAGIGVAMGNASDRVKAVSDYITKTNDEDGAALALEHFLLKG